MSHKAQEDLTTTIVIFVVIAFVCFLLTAVVGWFENRIDHDEAQARFAELAGVTTNQVEVIRHSNSSMIFGDPHDVTYELKINGQPASGRCFSSEFSEMVCRLYDYGDGGD